MLKKDFDLQLFADGDPPAPGDPPVGDPPPGDPPKPPAAGDPPVDKSGDTVDKAYADRLRREKADADKRAQDAERKLREREEKDLQEQGKWKELAEKALKEKSDAEAASESRVKAMQARLADEALKSECIKLGILDADLATLADKSKIQVTDDMVVVGATEVAQALQASKPHLFKKGGKGNAAAPAAPPAGDSLDDPPKKDYMRADQKEVDEEWGKIGTQKNGSFRA